MSQSIISNKPECIVCGQTFNLHKHHIFYGTANRKQSEKYGCWCYLCARHHNMSDHGVHGGDNLLDLKLKRMCQEILERGQGWSREQVIDVFGRSWL